MIKTNTKKIAEILGSISTIINEEVNNICTDSRNVFKGDLFIALRGEKFDGHEFLKDALDKGAAAVVVDKLDTSVPAVRQILVDDTTKAYGQIGAYVRSLYKGKVIGLTGSSGKTTLKEELGFVLKKFVPISLTEGNFNNHIGVPRSLCNLDMNSEYAIIEMGMSAKGELSYLTSLVKPDIAIINNVYPMHIEFFKGGIKEIAQAKAEIFEGLPQNGYAIINNDTNCVEILKEKAQKYNMRTFGKENILEVSGTSIIAKINDETLGYELSSKGEHHIYNSLCVLTTASVLGLDLNQAAGYLKDFEPLPGRGKHHKLKIKDGTYTLIDDSYSGQPEAIKIAIKALSETDGRKIAIIGKMGELGKFEKEKHIEIGKLLADSNIDIVIGVCEPTKDILAQLPPQTEQYYFENHEGLDAFLLNKLLQNNDIVLIKGSHYGSQVYKIAESLIRFG